MREVLIAIPPAFFCKIGTAKQIDRRFRRLPGFPVGAVKSVSSVHIYALPD